MPTREEALAELYRRGKLDDNQRQAVEELARRGKLTLPSAEAPATAPAEDPESIPSADDIPAQQETAAQPAPDSFGDNALDVLGEFAAGANRSVTEFLDFIGPDTANALLSLAGVDARVPTLTGALESTGIQGGFMEPGMAREAVAAAGQAAPIAAGFKAVPGRDLATARGAAAELLGAGSAAVTQPIAKAAEAVSDVVEPAARAVTDVIPEGKAKAAARLPLLRKSGDIAAAGFKLDDAGRVVKDEVQSKALKAGVDEGAVAMISASNPATKKRIADMVDIVEKGKKNLEFRSLNRPSKVVGEAINDRLRVIKNANREAGGNIDRVAKSLQGKPVDVAPAVNQFITDLADEGILFNPQTGSLDFSDSTIEGLPEAQGIIKRVVKRLYDTKDPTRNAYKVHTAKKFIDEQVSYGRSQAGLSGRMENLVKGLRRNLDGILDQNFPEYDQVNTVYKETRDVIDELQSLAGPRVDLSGDNVDKALGVMSRKVLSNYASGTAMETMFSQLDDTARRYSTPLNASVDDELIKMIAAESEIRRLFPTAVAPNTFQGEIGSEVARGAAEALTGNKAGLLGRAAKVAGRVFTKDDEAKIAALKDLLSNQKGGSK